MGSSPRKFLFGVSRYCRCFLEHREDPSAPSFAFERAEAAPSLPFLEGGGWFEALLSRFELQIGFFPKLIICASGYSQVDE